MRNADKMGQQRDHFLAIVTHRGVFWFRTFWIGNLGLGEPLPFVWTIMPHFWRRRFFPQGDIAHQLKKVFSKIIHSTLALGIICIATAAAAAESNLSSLTQKVANTLQLTALDNLETHEYTWIHTVYYTGIKTHTVQMCDIHTEAQIHKNIYIVNAKTLG